MELNLSTLAVALGLLLGLPSTFGLFKPAAFGQAARNFPRSIGWGYLLMGVGTAWFVWNVSQESIADFAAYKSVLLALFAAVGVGACIFVRDFLAVRGLAVVLLLTAKLMVDTGRPMLEATPWVLVIQSLAYVWVVAGIWLTVSPWRLRDLLNWATATEQRTRILSGVRLSLALLILVLGMTAFRVHAGH